jgi:hypothetical protein
MNRTSTSVLTLAVILSVVATPFRPSSSRGSASHPTRQEDSNRRQRSHPRKTTSKSGQCKADNSFRSKLIEAISLTYAGNKEKSGSAKECPQNFTVPAAAGSHKVETHVVFAFVPDPKHTNLALLFDRQLEALQQGIQDAGWTFDQALMPWDNKEHPEFSDFVSRDLEEASEHDTEKEPGLLIFRRANDTDPSLTDKLLVFVVGESPTGGVRKVQFWSAAQLVQKLFDKQTPRVLRVFGPTFSGSLQSLSELLECEGTNDFPCGATRIIEFSGTVTSRPAVERFKKANPKITFATFQEYDDYAISRFLNFAVQRRAYLSNEIAVLSEDESAYGSSGFCSEDSQTRGDSSSSGEENCDVVRLYFPREISQLRNAYQQKLAEPSQSEKVQRTTLPLDLESPGSNDDTVPEYSHKQLPLSQEAVLLSIASELRYHGIKLIVLRATNSLDQLFLARYLRSAYPQGRIVILGTDLLFRREIQDSRLHGIMALSTYSLTPGSDHEFQQDTETKTDHASAGATESHNHVDRVFPSSDAVGTYNATKLLTATLDHQIPDSCDVVNHPECLPQIHLFQYGAPMLPKSDTAEGMSQSPPVHLTVLGHEGFADVAVLQPASPSETSLPKVTDPNRHPEPEGKLWQGWRFFWILAVVIALGYSYFILSASILSSSEAVAHLGPPQADSRGWLFAVNAYLHFVLLLTVLWPYLYFFDASRFEKWSLVAVMAVVAVVGAWDLGRRRFAVMACALLAACLLTAVWLVQFRPIAQDDSGYMFVARAVQLTSGVSPLLPILLLLGAGLWGAWYSLSSSSLVDGRRPALPARGHLSDADGDFSKKLRRFDSILENDNQRLLKLLRADFVEGRAIVAGLITIAAVWWCAAFRFRPLQTLERTGYEYLLAGIITFITMLLLAGILRIQSIWAELRRLLVSLDSLPLRRGFKRLEGFSWSPMWRVGAGSLTELRRLLCRQFESWRCLHNLSVPGIKNISDRFLERASKVRDAYETAKINYVGGDRPNPDMSHSPAAGMRPQQAVFAGAAGSAGAAAQMALEEEPRDRAAFVERTLCWLKAPWRWARKVFAQGALDRTLIAEFCTFQQEFAKAGSYALVFSETQWEEATSVASNGEKEEGSAQIAAALQTLRQTREEKTQAREEEERSTRLHACEEFVALLYTAFILVVLVRIRGLIVAVGGMYVLLLAALSVYPFQPQLIIRAALMGLLVVIVGIVGFVYAQMHRDSTLSYITDTKPGELGVNFWIRIGSFVAVPLFGLLASQYPEIGNMFSSWLEPAMNALK